MYLYIASIVLFLFLAIAKVGKLSSTVRSHRRYFNPTCRKIEIRGGRWKLDVQGDYARSDEHHGQKALK